MFAIVWKGSVWSSFQDARYGPNKVQMDVKHVMVTIYAIYTVIFGFLHHFWAFENFELQN